MNARSRPSVGAYRTEGRFPAAIDIDLFAFYLARHGGETSYGAFFGVQGAAGLLAQFLAGDEFGHGIASFQKYSVCLKHSVAKHLPHCGFLSLSVACHRI